MAKWIRSLGYTENAYRIGIPIKIIKARGWDVESYLVIDDQYPDCLVIRRLPLDESKDWKRQGRPPGPH